MIAKVFKLIKGGDPLADDGDAEHVVLLCKEDRVADLIASWLQQACHKVCVTKTGPEAYQALAKAPHGRQTLLTDRVFPPWPGLVSIARLKREIPGLRVIVVQDGNTDPVAMAVAAGADGGINRPLNRADLFAILEMDGAPLREGEAANA